jgi:cytochrome c-type biogenesis protein CcmF
MRGEHGHEWLLDVSLKSAWLLFTIGIALGGLWAYQVLGWGGYWAWDPVETASLLPWLALTAYFHGGSKAGEDLFRESMVVLSFDSLLFLSALTRGGLLNSVHAYAFSPAGPALLICVVAATAYYLWLVAKTRKPLIKIPDSHSPTYHKLMLASSLSLLGIFAVCFIGVIVPTVENLLFGSAEATSFDFYNYVSLPFVLVFVIASMFCGDSSKRLPLYALVVAVIAAGAFLMVGFPSTYIAVNAALPLLVAAAMLTTVNLFKVLSTRKIAILGRQLIHLSVMVVLIGVFISSSMSSTPRTVTLATSTPVTIDDIEISIRDPEMTLGSGSAYMEEIDYVVPEKSSMSVEVKIAVGGQTFEGVLVEQFYPNYGLVSHPTILGDGVTDIYMNLAMDQSSYNALFNALIGVDTPPTTITIQVAKKPMTNVIWWGAAAMSVGIFGSLLATLKTRKTAPQA